MLSGELEKGASGPGALISGFRSGVDVGIGVTFEAIIVFAFFSAGASADGEAGVFVPVSTEFSVVVAGRIGNGNSWGPENRLEKAATTATKKARIDDTNDPNIEGGVHKYSTA